LSVGCKHRGWAAVVLLVAMAWLASPSLAQDATEAGRLLKIIEEQQRRLDAQDAEIDQQRQMLQDLRQQVESLQGGGAPSPSAAPVDTPAALAASPAPSAPEHPGFEDLGQAIEAAQEDWPGSFGLPGGNTRFQLSGFAELDFMHDSDAIQTPTAFVPSAIDTSGATAAEKGYSQTNASAQSSRLALETRTSLQERQLTTFIAVDMLNDLTTTAAQFHLRQAYGEVNNVLFGGDLRFGHDWATYTNIDTIPNVLDAQGPQAMFVTRHPQIRWSKGVGSGLKLLLAAEATDVHLFEGAKVASRWPDGVASLLWESDSSLLQGSLLARDLRASAADGLVDSAFAWGANISGRFELPGIRRHDFVSFSLTYGDGIGGVINDTPPDASLDTAGGRLETIPTLAWFMGYQHWWNPNFFSVVAYGEVRQDNLAFQDPGAYRRTQYATANLSWTPFEKWLFGIEALYGTREDKDGAQGSDFRSLLVSRFSF